MCIEAVLYRSYVTCLVTVVAVIGMATRYSSVWHCLKLAMVLVYTITIYERLIEVNIDFDIKFTTKRHNISTCDRSDI